MLPDKSTSNYMRIDPADTTAVDRAYKLCYNDTKDVDVPKEASILKQADNLVNGDRQEQYGSPVQNMTDIAELASRMLNKEFTASDMAMILLCVKLGRLKYQYKADSIIDMCGYAEIYNRCKEKGV